VEGFRIRVRQISWEDFSEGEIHLLLSRFFEDEGYKVYNVHRIQRSEEKGCDLIVEKSGSKIAIAVKKRPVSKDRIQLRDLNKREEEEKWYIYVKDPTSKFKEEMKEYPEIKYLSKKDLNEYLFGLNPRLYTWLLLDNQELSYFFMEITRLLVKFSSESEKGQKIKRDLDRDSLKILWRLKDDAVSLHKIFKFSLKMFESIEDKEPNIEEDVIILDGFLKAMKDLIVSCQSILSGLRRFYEKNKSFVYYV